MAAVQAMQVVENRLIHEITKRGTHRSSGNATGEAGQQTSSDPSKNRDCWTCKGANRCADTSARCSSGYARGDTGDGADRTAYLAAMVSCLELD